MKKVWVLFCLTIFNTIIFLGFFSNNVNAGEAGVGVGNIPPKFNMIRLTSQDDNFRVYLTVFDHNSWEVFFYVIIALAVWGILCGLVALIQWKRVAIKPTIAK